MIRTTIMMVLVFLLSVGIAWARPLFAFKGEVDFTNNHFDLSVDIGGESSILASGHKLEGDDYRLSLNIQHLKSQAFDLSSQIESSLAVIKNQQGGPRSILGRLSSQYSLIDYKPVNELSGRFEIKDQRIYFSSLSFLHLAVNGYLSLKPPYQSDLVLELDSMGMQQFLSFWMRDNQYDSSGHVSGQIKISGPLSRLHMRGRLLAYDGHIKGLKFDNIQLNAEGIYPDLDVSQTMISRSDGVAFFVAGPIDLSDQENFKKQIKALQVSPLVNETASQTEWTIRRLKSADSTSTELKYFLRKDTDSSGPEAAMLGLEQTVEF